MQSLFDGAVLPSWGLPGFKRGCDKLQLRAMSAMPRKRRLAVKMAPVAMGQTQTKCAAAISLASITSSARMSTAGETVTPSALAVFKVASWSRGCAARFTRYPSDHT